MMINGCIWQRFFSFRFSRTAMFCYISILVLFLDYTNCANFSSSLEKKNSDDFKSATTENSTFSHRYLYPVDYIAPNPYQQVPSFAFPFYQNVKTGQQLVGSSPHLINGEAASRPVTSQNQKKRVKVKNTVYKTVDVPKGDDGDNDNVSEKVIEKPKQKKQKRQKVKIQEKENEIEKVESKTVDDEGRGCPACVDGACDPFLDPSTNISGIPVIQIIIALIIGAFWAAIFAFILHNFIEYKHEEEDDGYGYGAAPMPAYGAPTSQYGAPQSSYGAPSTGYSSNSRISSRKGYGRRYQGFSFNDLSNSVWSAIDKLINKYDDNENMN